MSGSINIRLPTPYEAQKKLVYWSDINPQAQCLVAPCGTKTGKAVCLNTPIPTPSGWKAMKDIATGDYVFSENGTPIVVTGISETQHNRDCYEVIFSDGSTITADGEHLWVTSTHNDRKNIARALSENDRCKTTEAVPQARTTKQILDTLYINLGGVSRANHSIPVCKPLDFPTKDLPIDPYLLGLWLGNGTSISGELTFNKRDICIIKEIQSRGHIIYLPLSKSLTWRVEGLSKQLRLAGFISNKHIPEVYLTAGVEQRLDLLRGLMDSDGTIDTRGVCCFDNTNINLADGVEALALSLGIKCTRGERVGKLDGIEHKICYRVRFTTDLKVFNSEFKVSRLRKISLKSKHRTIVSINKVESVPVKCITVDNPTHLFLVGKACIPTHNSLGSSIWLAKENLVNDNLYSVWIGPTFMKAKIGYRYIKAMLPDHPSIDCVDSRLEIRFGNRSFIKFLHGKDAETTVEGEAIDRFVVDESGKQSKQLWYSLFTTLTQTGGLGIVTGTPRGFTWYYDIFRKAKAGDPFFSWLTLRTQESPYVKAKAIEQARRLLPKALFDQYYNALFVSMSTVFGDVNKMFDNNLVVDPGARFWVHPDQAARDLDTVTGWDMAKHRDYSVFYTVNTLGKLVGYARFRQVPYEQQVDRLKMYLHKYFNGDRMLRYDATGVGNAVGEMIVDKDIDASVTAVIFSQKSKQEMVSRTSMAIESGWHSAPRIEQIEHEFGSYELTVTKSGLFSYSAPDGEHDDVVSAAMLAVSGAYQLSASDEAEKYLEKYMTTKSENSEDDDAITEAAEEFSKDMDDDFFDDNAANEDNDFEADIDYM